MKVTVERYGQWHLEVRDRSSALDSNVRAACSRYFLDAVPFETRDGEVIPEWARCPLCRLLAATTEPEQIEPKRLRGRPRGPERLAIRSPGKSYLLTGIIGVIVNLVLPTFSFRGDIFTKQATLH